MIREYGQILLSDSEQDFADAAEQALDAADRYKEQLEETQDLLWALAERVAPELTLRWKGASEMVKELISFGADEGAEHLLRGMLGDD